jgi:hypothetical protein
MNRQAHRRDGGQGVLEYFLIVVLIALVVLFALRRFGGTVSRRYDCARMTAEHRMGEPRNPWNVKSLRLSPHARSETQSLEL